MSAPELNYSEIFCNIKSGTQIFHLHKRKIFSSQKCIMIKLFSQTQTHDAFLT